MLYTKIKYFLYYKRSCQFSPKILNDKNSKGDHITNAHYANFSIVMKMTVLYCLIFVSQMAIKGLLFPQSHGYLLALVINILEFYGNTLKTDIYGFLLFYVHVQLHEKLFSQTFKAFTLL